MKYHYSIHERYFKCMCCVQVSFSRKKKQHQSRDREEWKKISLESHRIQLNGCSCILWCKQRLLVIHLKPINWCCTHCEMGSYFNSIANTLNWDYRFKTISFYKKNTETYVEHKNVSTFFLFDLDIIQWNSLIWQHFK